jgi:hypothetical protein
MTKRISYILFLLFSLKSFASDYELVGSYLLEYSIFKIDVYQITYFKGKNNEKLVLDYKTSVKKKYSIEGWKAGLKDKLQDKSLEAKVQWLFDHTTDLENGDQLTLIKSPTLLEIYKNEKLLGKTSDAVVIALAFEPWLGEKPVDDKLKLALLGKE